MEDSMFDEQFVTTAEEIKQAREALLKLGLEIARRGTDAEFNEAQIVFANSNARMEVAAPGDDEANKAAEAANRRLFAYLRRVGRGVTSCCSTVTGSTRSVSATTTKRKGNALTLTT